MSPRLLFPPQQSPQRPGCRSPPRRGMQARRDTRQPAPSPYGPVRRRPFGRRAVQQATCVSVPPVEPGTHVVQPSQADRCRARGEDHRFESTSGPPGGDFLLNLQRRSLADRDSLGLSLRGLEGSVLWSASAWPSCGVASPPLPCALCFLGREGSSLLTFDSGRMEYKRGLARDIRRISARTSGETLGRPGPFRRLFQVQKSVKPARCQRMTVSGWTMETASAQPCHRWASKTQNSRSERRRRGRGAARWRTASWCRNARFSSTRAPRVLSTRRRPMRIRVIMRSSSIRPADGSMQTRRTE